MKCQQFDYNKNKDCNRVAHYNCVDCGGGYCLKCAEEEDFHCDCKTFPNIIKHK
jgi:hypothetical protein